MENVTTKIVLDTRRSKNYNSYPDGHILYVKNKPLKKGDVAKLSIFPVKLRITYLRKQYYYPFPAKFDLTIQDYGKIFSPEAKLEYKKIQDSLIEERKTADKIIDDLGKDFSITLFEKKFVKPKGNTRDVFILLSNLVKTLKINDQISTAVLTDCALASLKEFHPKSQLLLEEIDKQFLNQYEKWMTDKENSPTTIGMYLRRVRVIFTEAVKIGLLLPDLYPFKEYDIPVGRNIKKAVSHLDIGRIARYKPISEGESKARDFWLLTFFCNGLNMKDIALLKRKNIQGDMIYFERAKTKRSNKSQPKIIKFHLTNDVKQIINRWGIKSIVPNSYIFPILHANATSEEIYKLVYNAVKNTNKHMKAISKKMGLTANITTYVARHSFSTIVRNSGRSIEYISEALGHSSIKTTQNYLASFEDEPVKEVGNFLTEFPQEKTA